MHGKHEVVHRSPAYIWLVMRRAVVLEDSGTVQAVRVSAANSPRSPGALVRARLRRPYDAPCACAGHVVVYSVDEISVPQCI